MQVRGLASTVTILALAAGALVGCSKSSEQTSSSESSASSEPQTTAPGPSAPAASGPVIGDKNFPMPAPNTCKLDQRNGQVLPDSRCTPGAIDPAVTQANLTSTICKPDWRKKAYPPVTVDDRMRTNSARSYGLPPDYEGEYDHLVSRMLGGSSEDPRNRWPQPEAKPNPKDRVEIALHEGVCKGMIPLATAQRALAASWVTAADAAGLQLIGDPNKSVEQSKACLRANPNRCTTLYKAYDD
jgi:hypothetical protein